MSELIINIVETVVSAILIAIITKIVIDKILDKSFMRIQKVGKGLQNAGIESVSSDNGKMSKRDVYVLFGKGPQPRPSTIKLCFISGCNFINDYFDELIEAVKNGTNIEVLILDPSKAELFDYFRGKYERKVYTKNDEEDIAVLAGRFDKIYNRKIGYADLPYCEKCDLLTLTHEFENLRQSSENPENTLEIWAKIVSKHKFSYAAAEAIFVKNILLEILKQKEENGWTGNVELHYYRDEYRIPITIAEYPYDKKNQAPYYLLWTNMNSPVKHTIESINVRGKYAVDEEPNFVSDMNSYFDYLMAKYPQDQLKVNDCGSFC